MASKIWTEFEFKQKLCGGRSALCGHVLSQLHIRAERGEASVNITTYFGFEILGL